MTFFGFDREARERKQQEKLTELEKELGIIFIEQTGDRYGFNIGEETAVHVGNTTLYGVYRGVSEEGVGILMPSIVGEEVCVSGKFDREYRLEAKRPNSFEMRFVEGMSPLTPGYLERFVREHNEALQKIREARASAA